MIQVDIKLLPLASCIYSCFLRICDSSTHSVPNYQIKDPLAFVVISRYDVLIVTTSNLLDCSQYFIANNSENLRKKGHLLIIEIVPFGSFLFLFLALPTSHSYEKERGFA